MSTPLDIDAARIGRIAQQCDDHEEKTPRDKLWREEHTRLYAELARACETAGRNAT